MKRCLNYVAQHYQWIIGILVAGLTPLLIYLLQSQAQIKHNTNQYYYSSPINAVMQNVSKLDAVTCWEYSLSSDRRDAYRCSSSSHIIDPCFTLPNSDAVVSCPPDPYSKPDYFRVEGELPYDQSYETSTSGTHYPWFIVLFDGSRCGFITGATALIGDMRIDYGCSGGSEESLLLPIKTAEGLQEINCYKNGIVSSCDIKESWF